MEKPNQGPVEKFFLKTPSLFVLIGIFYWLDLHFRLKARFNGGVCVCDDDDDDVQSP